VENLRIRCALTRGDESHTVVIEVAGFSKMDHRERIDGIHEDDLIQVLEVYED